MLYFNCLPDVLWLLVIFVLTVPRVGMQCVIVIFPDHTHLPLRKKYIFETHLCNIIGIILNFLLI